MADRNVKVSFVGDAANLEKASKDASKAVEDTAEAVEDAAKEIEKSSGKFSRSTQAMEGGFDGLRDGADDTERRVVGFRDALTGTGDVMKGLRDGDMVTLATGFADLASSVANLGADMLEWGKKAWEAGRNVVASHGASVAAKAKDVAATVAHRAAAIASTVATHAQAAAQWALNAAMSANPIMLIVVAIAALVAAIVIAYKNSEDFRNIVDAVGRAFLSLWENGLKPVGEWLIGTLVPWVRDHVVGAFRALIGVLFEAGSTLAGWVADVWRLGGEVVAFFRDLPGNIAGFFAGLGQTLIAPFRWAFNEIAGLWNGTVGKLSFKAPDWVPGLGGKGWDVPDIPKLAAGGIVTRPTLALVGEAGPEAVVPLSQAGSVLGPAGGVVNITVNALDPRAAGRAVVDAIKSWERANGTSWRTA